MQMSYTGADVKYAAKYVPIIDCVTILYATFTVVIIGCVMIK